MPTHTDFLPVYKHHTVEPRLLLVTRRFTHNVRVPGEKGMMRIPRGVWTGGGCRIARTRIWRKERISFGEEKNESRPGDQRICATALLIRCSVVLFFFDYDGGSLLRELGLMETDFLRGFRSTFFRFARVLADALLDARQQNEDLGGRLDLDSQSRRGCWGNGVYLDFLMMV